MTMTARGTCIERVYALAVRDRECVRVPIFISTFCRLIILWLAFCFFSEWKPKQRKKSALKMCTKKKRWNKVQRGRGHPFVWCFFRVYVREYIASEILDTLSYCQRRVQQESTISRITHSGDATQSRKTAQRSACKWWPMGGQADSARLHSMFATAAWIKSSTDNGRLNW